MPSVGLSVTTVHLLFPDRHCFPIFQMLFSNHVLSASFGFAFCLSFGELEDCKSDSAHNRLTQSRISPSQPYHTCTCALFYFNYTLYITTSMPLFKSGAKKQGKEHKIWNQKVWVSRASMSIFICKIPIAVPISQDYCENWEHRWFMVSGTYLVLNMYFSLLHLLHKSLIHGSSPFSCVDISQMTLVILTKVIAPS